MINFFIAIFFTILALVFGWRAANDFGFKFSPKISLPFVGEFTKYAPTETKPDIDQPKLKLSMSGANVFVPDGEGLKQLTGIALNVKTWNTGTPSVAANWSLVVTPQSNVPVVAQLTKIPNSLKLSGNFNNVSINSVDALDVKTSSTPIGEIPVEGVLLFYVKLPKNVVSSSATHFELSVQDIYGNVSTTTQLMGNWLQW